MLEFCRINFIPQITMAVDDRKNNFEYNIKKFKMLDLSSPTLQGKRVAIVGGSPSLINHLEELKEYDVIWAINGTYKYLKEKGIKSVFVTVDADFQDVSDVEEAIVINTAKRELIDNFKTENIRLVSLEPQFGEPFLNGGTTTATRLPHLAFLLGCFDIGFFGCDSSYNKITHIYGNTIRSSENKTMLIVKTDNKEFITNVQMLNQAENLAIFIKEFPEFIKNHSEGLLKAMVKDDNWTTVAFSELLYKDLLAGNCIDEQPIYKEIVI
jgi:hypothetical protein